MKQYESVKRREGTGEIDKEQEGGRQRQKEREREREREREGEGEREKIERETETEKERQTKILGKKKRSKILRRHKNINKFHGIEQLDQ